MGKEVKAYVCARDYGEEFEVDVKGNQKDIGGMIAELVCRYVIELAEGAGASNGYTLKAFFSYTEDRLTQIEDIEKQEETHEL